MKEIKCYYCNNIKSIDSFRRLKSYEHVKICKDCEDERGKLESIGYRKCLRCFQSKNCESFYKKCSSTCKRCHNVNSRNYAIEHRDEIVRRRKQFYRDNREKILREQSKRKQKNPEKEIYLAAKCRAKKNGIIFTLKLEDVFIPEYCPILNIKLQSNYGKSGASDNSPSLDRIIPDLGYTKENTRIISNRANRLKSDGTGEEHELIAKYIKLGL